VSSPAAEAESALIRISPAPARADIRAGGVDGVAERREVARIALADAADEGRSGVDAHADRDPRARAVAAGLLDQVARGCDRGCRVLGTGKAGNEERDRCVADELVDDAVTLVDHVGGRAVETRKQARELLRRHPLGEAGGTADVGEQHRDLDLGAAGAFVHAAQAPLAETAVQR
jgi:hypothetical protein